MAEDNSRNRLGQTIDDMVHGREPAAIGGIAALISVGVTIAQRNGYLLDNADLDIYFEFVTLFLVVVVFPLMVRARVTPTVKLGPKVSP